MERSRRAFSDRVTRMGQRIRLLGGFRVVKVGMPVTVRSGGKTEGLLSSLALQEGYHGC